MFTTVFKKSNPIIYFLSAIFFVGFFILYQTLHFQSEFSGFKFFQKTILLGFLLTTILLSEMIAKKNGLTKNNSFIIYFSICFYLFFPNMFEKSNLIIANLLVAFALRRIVAIQSLSQVKIKIFDASLLISLASLFHFWAILFIILLYITLIISAVRDYHDWLLPFVAMIAVTILIGVSDLVLDNGLLANLIQNIVSNDSINYFRNIFENISFSIYLTIALTFATSMFLKYSQRTVFQNNTLKIVLAWLLVSLLIFVFSPKKSNADLMFSIAPITILIANHVEITKIYWQKEMVVLGIFLCAMVCYFGQL